MWTHRSPELEPQLTRRSIKRAARIESYRALASGNLVAMTGSGATMIYGYPRWDELPALFVRAFNGALAPDGKESCLPKLMLRQHIANMVKQYQVLAGCQDQEIGKGLPLPKSGNPGQIIELLEALLVEIDRLEDRRSARETGGAYFHKARELFARDMKRKRYERLFLTLRGSWFAATRSVGPIGDAPVSYDELKDLKAEIKDCGFAETKDQLDLVAKFSKLDPELALRLLQSENLMFDAVPPATATDPDVPQNEDVLASLFGDLGIRRVVTLNYDVEIERTLLRQSTLGDGSETKKFRALTDHCPGISHVEPETALVDGTRRFAMSTTLIDGNIASVTNFATHPEAYEGQVLHFHGSANDPESLILSQSDYLNRYAKTEEQRRSFDEAREILFGGNDFLFIGIGMSEDEVLQPLRRFLARTRHTRSGYCFTALMPGCVRKKTKDEWAKEKAAANSAGRDINALCEGTEDEAAMAAEALELRRNYGVNVIHFGTSGKLFKVLYELDVLAKLLEPAKLQNDCDRAKALEALTARAGRWGALRLKKAFAPWEKFQNIFDDLVGKLEAAPETAHASLATVLLRQAISATLIRAKSQALVKEFQDLAEGAGRWWEDWRQPPGERVAQYSPMQLVAPVKPTADDHHNLTSKAADQLASIELNANKEIYPMGYFFWARQTQDYLVLSAPVQWSTVTTAHKAFREDYDRYLNTKLDRPNMTGKTIRDLPVHRRIARVAIPRGGGKAAFMSRFMDPVQIKRLFGEIGTENLTVTHPGKHTSPYSAMVGRLHSIPPGRARVAEDIVHHRAGFMVHYTFSIEFSSVITALSRFFSGNVADALVEIHQTSSHPDHDFVQVMFDGLAYDGENQLRIVKDTGGDNTAISYADFVAQWTTYPRMVPDLAHFTKKRSKNFPCHVKGMPPQVERRHRLDILRQTMEIYAWLCRVPSFANKRRLFLCLSNLDRLCSTGGDGFNAMHRSFFRTVIGQNEGAIEPVSTGSRFLSGDLPLDVLLVSSNPEAPIRYLSEEFRREPKDQPYRPPDAFGKTPLIGLPPKESEMHSNASITRVPLRKWSRVGTFTWDERAYMMSFAKLLEANCPKDGEPVRMPDQSELSDDESIQNWRLRFFLDELNRTGVDRRPLDPTHNHRFRFLLRTLWDNLALSNWVLTYWCTQETVQRFDEDDTTARQKAEGTRRKFLAALDREASIDGVDGVIREILARYEKLDRANKAVVLNGNGAEKTQVPQDYSSELFDQIMRHMTLFALPIELWVLMGCPKIRNCLDRLIGDKLTEEKNADRKAVIRRYYRLKTLRQHIDQLVCRGLIVPIRSVLGGDLEAIEKAGEEEKALHKRFILHGQIRTHVAKSMKLALPAQGDNRNQQVSIYCDHSNETTTPSDEHYFLIADLLENSIRQCRESLWTAAQFSDTSDLLHFSSEARTNAAGKAAVRRLLIPGRQDQPAKTVKTVQTLHHSLWPARGRSPKAKKTSLKSVILSPRVRRLNPNVARLAPKSKRQFLRSKKLSCLAKRPEFAPNGLAGAMGRIHAVPQRLRAMMSLLRGVFSLGVMARLEHVAIGRGEETPFENYGRWLRSLSSAAASLEVNHDTIENVFETPGTKASFFNKAEDPNGIFKPSEQENMDPKTLELRKRFAQAANTAGRGIGFGAVQTTAYNKLRRPYYRDEIAWLYNERGLTALIQGRASNALQLFNSARFIMTHKMVPARDSKAYHAVERRILLNIAIASIEVGEIRTARGYLDELLMSDIHVEHSTPSRMELFARGYRGLCDHLSGSLDEAQKTYDAVIDTCSELRFHRALAIFYRHRADLLSRQGEFEKAIQQARLAEQAASEAGQQDIRHLALVSVAQAQINLRNIRNATAAINRALDYGERMGIYRIQADALLMRAKMYLVLGDSGLAGTACSQAISLCNKFGLNLRKLTALKVYAETLADSGKKDIARSILTEAITDATRYGYQTMASDASRYLSILLGTEHSTMQ